MTRATQPLPSAIVSASTPELSRSVGGGHLAEARLILRRSVQVSLVLGMSILVGLALFGGAIVRWWTHGLVDPPVLLLAILLAEIVAGSTWGALVSVLTATNRHKRAGMLYFAGATIGLLAAVPLCAAFGLAGAAMSLFAIDIAMAGYVFPAALRIVEDAPVPFVRALLDVRGIVGSVIAAMRRYK